ncbi:MAG: D-aminoacyl-tRNA deacylase [Thermoleophilia bacterium]
MRAVIQRVSRAKVTSAGSIRGEIGRGLLVLLGVASGDGSRDAAFMAGKVSRLRIFPDAAGLMNLSVAEAGGAVLAVSQFTLLGNARKGNRPSFGAAAEPALAEKLYREVVEGLRNAGLNVQTGEFGARMEVELVNDGPVTIILESPEN